MGDGGEWRTLELMTFPKVPGYQIEKALGRGGMAQVYLALQESVKRKVALKIMSQHLGEDSVWAKRFIQEAQVIAQLSHPNIVPVYDVGTFEGRYFISMEYLASGSLKDKKRGGIHLAEVVKIVAGVAAGLDYAGQKNFVHRDIKPDNIMFRDDGSPVILDFGIVKQVDGSGMTQTGVIVGTSAYMSPEQAQGRELDQRSDIYSLGIMFYELLVGKVPFKGDTDVATLLQHIKDEVPRLPESFAVFQPLIDRCLEKDPADRYERALDFINHLYELEPEIKLAIESHYRAKALDETIQKTVVTQTDDADLDDATVAMESSNPPEHAGSSTSETSPITVTADLTEVLSSAKATIRDFSEEARKKRARRLRLSFSLLALFMVSAIGFAAYQQLYVVPRERAAAEQRIADEKLRTQKRIAALLTEASSYENEALNNFEAADKRMSLYSQVLRLDPENTQANESLLKLADKYLVAAKSAIADKDLVNAEAFKDYAEALNPDNPEIDVLRRKIRSLRADALDLELVQEEVENLKALAKIDLKSSPGFSESAYSKLQQAKRLNPNDGELADLQSALVEKSFIYLDESVASGRLAAARKELDFLSKYSGDSRKLADAQQKINRESNRQSKQARLSDLKKTASILEKERRTNRNNEELRAYYQDILSLAPLDKSAAQGMNNVLKFDATQARSAIREADFDYASKKIAVITATNPEYYELKNLNGELQAARAQQSDRAKLAASIQQLISANSNGETRRSKLKQALSEFDQLKALAADEAELDRTHKQLEEAYVLEISSLIADKKSSLVRAYFDDVARRAWPSDRLLQLKESFDKPEEKSKTKRVLPGGF